MIVSYRRRVILAATMVLGLVVAGTWVAGDRLAARVTGTPVAADGAGAPSRPATTPAPSATSPVPEPGADLVITAVDGRSEITVPPSWMDMLTEQPDQELLDGIVIGVAGRSWSEVFVNRSNHEDFSGFDAYVAIVEQVFTDLADGDLGGRQATTVNGLPGYRYQFTGSGEGRRSVYWVAVLDGEHGYYDVIGASPPSRAELQEAEIVEVIESFRELPNATSG